MAGLDRVTLISRLKKINIAYRSAGPGAWFRLSRPRITVGCVYGSDARCRLDALIEVLVKAEAKRGDGPISGPVVEIDVDRCRSN